MRNLLWAINWFSPFSNKDLSYECCSHSNTYGHCKRSQETQSLQNKYPVFGCVLVCYIIHTLSNPTNTFTHQRNSMTQDEIMATLNLHTGTFTPNN